MLEGLRNSTKRKDIFLRFLVNNEQVNLSSDCDICPSPLTDHCAITPSASPNDSLPQPRMFHWKFNSNSLESNSFCNRILSLISEVKLQGDLSPKNKWEWLKYNVRKIGIQEDKKLASSRRKQQLDIISKITYLCSQTNLNDENNLELHQLQLKLDDLYTEKAKGAFIRSKERWIEDGEKNSSYFLNLEKSRQAKKVVNKLLFHRYLMESHRAQMVSQENFTNTSGVKLES